MGLVGENMDIKFHMLQDITNKFGIDRVIGSGGYGIVYKGLYNGQVIAVKRLRQLMGLDDNAFDNEFRNLCKIQHPNIVGLIGYCNESQRKFIRHEGKLITAHEMERVLCFEYVEGGNLENHISDESCGLNWPTCFKIIKGTCEGLHHLHSAQGKPIYHLDLKPANILLDKMMTAKIGDLGLSRLVSSTMTYQTEIRKGTLGYMPPEYIVDGTISKKFDVFSLGVMIIKIMAGNNGIYHRSTMPPKQFIELVTTNWKGKLQGTSGHSSPREIDISQVKRCIDIALRCVDENRDKRPEIKDIIDELEELEPRVDEMSMYSDLSEDPTGLQKRVVIKMSLQRDKDWPKIIYIAASKEGVSYVLREGDNLVVCGTCYPVDLLSSLRKHNLGDMQLVSVGPANSNKETVQIVIKMGLQSDKPWSKIFRIAAGTHGVDSVSRDGDNLVVCGDCDPIDLLSSLRKRKHKLGDVQLVSVGPANSKSKAGEAKAMMRQDKKQAAGKEEKLDNPMPGLQHPTPAYIYPC